MSAEQTLGIMIIVTVAWFIGLNIFITIGFRQYSSHGAGVAAYLLLTGAALYFFGG